MYEICFFSKQGWPDSCLYTSHAETGLQKQASEPKIRTERAGRTKKLPAFVSLWDSIVQQRVEEISQERRNPDMAPGVI
jgi:hypothetical protein